MGDGNGGETTQQQSQQSRPSYVVDEGFPAEGEEGQGPRNSAYDTAASAADSPDGPSTNAPSAPNTDATIDSPSTLFESPAVVDASAKERHIDNWPGRVVCREVCKEFLSWELEDGDFCVPQEGDETVDDGFEDTREQREEAAAVRAALLRQQAELRAVLRGIPTNEAAGVDGVGS